jgi:D-cysteine desulfhydrase
MIYFSYDMMILDNVKFDGYNIVVVRDDIFPFVGGGSKARKAIAYEVFFRENGYNAVVSCGGVQSNHNRAMALMCAKNGWKCHLCIQDSDNRFYNENGNALIVRLSGVNCQIIRAEETSIAMDKAMENFELQGLKPYYVRGGGHDLPGGTCFVDAVKELKEQCDRLNYKPDYIFLASGTGSTQAGIVVGLDLIGWSDVKCVGISIAREYERGRSIILDFANMLAKHYGIDANYDDSIIFNADYLMGGYEVFTFELEAFLNKVTRQTGLLFDTTYSGKGFYGMMHEIERLKLKNKNVIFWHTGGIMNIMK